MCGRQGTGPYGVSIAVDGAGGKRGGNYRFRLVRIAYSQGDNVGVALRRLLEPH
jgi:catalase (peroxidase I)